MHVACVRGVDGAETIATALSKMPRLTALNVGGTSLLYQIVGILNPPFVALPSPLSTFIGSACAKSNSKILGSALAGLTDLVELDLWGTQPFVRDKATAVHLWREWCFMFGAQRFLATRDQSRSGSTASFATVVAAQIVVLIRAAFTYVPAFLHAESTGIPSGKTFLGMRTLRSCWGGCGIQTRARRGLSDSALFWAQSHFYRGWKLWICLVCRRRLHHHPHYLHELTCV